MSRTKQIVDWVLEAGLYVIMNIHHDEKDFFKNLTIKNFKYIWT